jgi:hypothetical protein
VSLSLSLSPSPSPSLPTWTYHHLDTTVSVSASCSPRVQFLFCSVLFRRPLTMLPTHALARPPCINHNRGSNGENL